MSNAKPVRIKESQGWCLPFGLPLSFARSKLQDRNEGSGTPANAGHQPPHLAMRRAPFWSAHACRRSTAALEYLNPKAQLQARLPGTWSARALPAFACPSPGMHLPSRSSCREADTQAAREQPAKPPAGTALAPMTRCASAPCPSRERGLHCNCYSDLCQGKSDIRYDDFVGLFLVTPTRRGRACPACGP